ncbi:hypothetical protein GWK47_044141 [Chionoecetes opilio]|uniref:Uncharacterized protein n=1 Tax=Chionoecetes opilio TaxID=41210 RepID=A0A8J5CVJ4_CHIOP|nr:hypothetical protein GWK47_044141 [Chionoecetes opilio]
MEHQEGGLGKFQASLERVGSLRATRRPAPTERDLTAALQRAADAAIPKCSPGRRHRPTGGSTTRTSGSTTTESTCTESCINEAQPHQPAAVAGCGDSRSAGVSAGQEAKWLGAPPSTQHTSLGPCGGMFRTASGFRPPPTGPPTHTHTERRRDSNGVFTAAWLQRPTSSSHTPNPQQQLRQHRVEAVREGRGETRKWRTTSSLARNFPSARKKGRDTAAGTDGVTYSPARVMPGLPGTGPRCSPRSTPSWLAGHLPPAWKEGPYSAHPQPREPTKLRPISSSAAG